MNPAWTSLLLRLPAAAPEPFIVNSEDSSTGFGLGVDLGVLPFEGGALLINPTLDVWYGEYDDILMPMKVLVWEPQLDLGIRWDTWSYGSTKPVAFWWDVALGPHASVLQIAGGEPAGGVTVGAHSGFGLLFGKGAIRGNVGVRMSANFSLATASGGTTVDDESVYWSYYIGGVRLAFLAGLEFR